VRALILSLLVLAAAPAAAQAGTVSVSGDTITFQAAPGEPNFVTVNWGQTGEYPPSISDNGPDIVAQAPCEQDGFGNVTCPTAGRARIVLRLGDGDDIGRSINAAARGTSVQILGEAGNDQLESHEGSDMLDGGPGDDELEPDHETTSAGDVLAGGDGVDHLQLVNTIASTVTVTLDGQANDGPPGDNDNYAADLENITGSRVAANTITGTDGPNVIAAWDQNDVLNGGGGDDRIDADWGNDRLDGGAGDDQMEGSSGDDVLIGGPGTDSMDGDGPGAFGQVIAGNDRIEARDGVPETINCGLATDTAIIDRSDTVPSDPQTSCENVERGTAAAARVKVTSKSLRYRKGRIAVKVRCPRGAACRGTLRIRKGKRTIASGRYRVVAGKSKTVRLKPGRKGRAILRRARRHRVVVELRPRGGSPVRARRTLRR
jgi:hemolysin type calcium-binding protein